MIAPGTKFGAFEIIERIGGGGMGTVFKAYQPSLARFVAIKVLPEQFASDPDLQQRFVQEGLAIAKLRHPNIVAAIDFGRENDVLYLVSEFVEGGTLADQVGSPLPLDYVVRMLAPIAAALDYAHARGVMHRDVKPSNVLLARDGTPVLSDFGLAKLAGPAPGLTQSGTFMGTYEYLAPEYAGGAEPSPAGDQYGLALTAYELLVGRRPFVGATPLALIFAQQNAPPPPPSQFEVSLPPQAEAALMRGLAKSPAERYPNCSAFVRALEAAPLGSSAAPGVAAAGRTRSVLLVRRAIVPSVLAAGVLLVGALALAGGRGGTAPAPTPSPSDAGVVPPPPAPAPPLQTATLTPVETSTTGPTTRPTTSPTRPPTPTPVPKPEVATFSSASDPVTLAHGAQGRCVIAYRNDGGSTWIVGGSTQVTLVFSDAAATDVRAWVTATAPLAVQSPDRVAPSEVATFAFAYTVPDVAHAGTAYWLVAHPVLGGAVIGPDAACVVTARDVDPTQ